MNRSRPLLGVLAMGAAACAACSSLGGLTGGGSDAGAGAHHEAAAGTQDARGPDGGPVRDARATDGASSRDARDAGIDSAEGGGSGKLGALGEPCSVAGATSCNGNDSLVVLVCTSGKWTSETVCSSSQRCDSTVGACADVASACVGKMPGARFCSSASVLECGPDLVTTPVVAACGSRQSCTPEDAGAACVCSTVTGCGAPGGSSCSSGSLLTCVADGDGCLYLETVPCTDGVCHGTDGGAACCTHDPRCTATATTCVAGSASCHSCTSNVFTTCTTGSDGCLVVESSGPCSTDNPDCVGSACGCASSTSCDASAAGTVCSASSLCSCTTNAECINEGCCGYDVGAGTTCIANGSSYVMSSCVEGNWQ